VFPSKNTSKNITMATSKKAFPAKRLAAFGLRSLPPKAGSAGEDKFSSELYPRLVQRGWKVTVYTRVYEDPVPEPYDFCGVRVIPLKTTRCSGFDTLLHSARATIHILRHNTGKVVHVHNGGNSIWAILLRLFAKRVFIGQDGADWKREKWPWYGKLYLYLSSLLTAYIPNGVIFDNIFTKEFFEKRYRKKFSCIHYGSEVPEVPEDNHILVSLGIEEGEYFLFVGRFIPDKGLHYLIPAFEKVATSKKLVLVGGSPNPSDYEARVQQTKDDRILFPGYIYGDDVVRLIKNAYAYIQPSDVEGLSPVILMAMGLKTPLICSDISENLYIVQNNATVFKKASIVSLKSKLEFSLKNPGIILKQAESGADSVKIRFNWDTITDRHVALFSADKKGNNKI
jgi:glycosyltransferase involved in cell wall biosynthesis